MPTKKKAIGRVTRSSQRGRPIHADVLIESVEPADAPTQAQRQNKRKRVETSSDASPATTRRATRSEATKAAKKSTGKWARRSAVEPEEADIESPK